MLILTPERPGQDAPIRAEPLALAVISLLAQPPWPNWLIITPELWPRIQVALHPKIGPAPPMTYHGFVDSVVEFASFQKNGRLCCIFAGGGIRMQLSTFVLSKDSQACAVRVYRWPHWPVFWHYTARLEIMLGMRWLSMLYTPPGLPMSICGTLYRLFGWRKLASAM